MEAELETGLLDTFQSNRLWCQWIINFIKLKAEVFKPQGSRCAMKREEMKFNITIPMRSLLMLKYIY